MKTKIKYCQTYKKLRILTQKFFCLGTSSKTEIRVAIKGIHHGDIYGHEKLEIT